jgi:hypothetical protein
MAVFAMLLLASGARGTTVFMGERVTVQVAGLQPVGSGAENLWSFHLIAVGDGDTTVGGFDGQIGGMLHQQIIDGASTPTLDEPLADHQVVTLLDSHFLVHGSQVVSVAPLAEDFDPQLPSQETPDATGPNAAQAQVGYGEVLSGTFARLGGSLSRWSIAQLVVPEGSTVELDFELGFGGDTPPPAELVQVAFVFDPSLLRVCGDFDSDTDVDSSDLTTLILNWTGSLDPGVESRSFSQGDCDQDGDVDSQDLTGLILNWTAVQASASMAVIPEPASAWISLAGLLGVSSVLRRRLRRGEPGAGRI